MSTLRNTHVLSDSVGLSKHSKTDVAPSSEASPTQQEIYARAEQRIRRGKKMVISGFVVSVLGIIAYCVVSFRAGANQELGSAVLDSPGRLVWPALAVIGLGTLLWLVGSFLYLSGGIDSDPNGPDLYF